MLPSRQSVVAVLPKYRTGLKFRLLPYKRVITQNTIQVNNSISLRKLQNCYVFSFGCILHGSSVLYPAKEDNYVHLEQYFEYSASENFDLDKWSKDLTLRTVPTDGTSRSRTVGFAIGRRRSQYLAKPTLIWSFSWRIWKSRHSCNLQTASYAVAKAVLCYTWCQRSLRAVIDAGASSITAIIAAPLQGRLEPSSDFP